MESGRLSGSGGVGSFAGCSLAICDIVWLLISDPVERMAGVVADKT
jgi:hypothetical protein